MPRKVVTAVTTFLLACSGTAGLADAHSEPATGKAEAATAQHGSHVHRQHARAHHRKRLPARAGSKPRQPTQRKTKTPSKPTTTTPTPTSTTPVPTTPTSTTPAPTTTTPTPIKTAPAPTSTTPAPTSTTPAPTTPPAPADPTGGTNPPVSSSAAPVPDGIAGNWNLVLDSDFSSSTLDPSLWRTGWFGSGVTGPVTDHEAACYSSANVSLSGGDLNLAVTDQSSVCQGQAEPYTGALVSTNPDDGRANGGFQYTYGVLEARAYVPASTSLIQNWPAVWADGQNWPVDGEDDLMEGLGGQACYHFHSPLGAPGECDDTVTPGWHTFASDWEPGMVTYYYDGNRVGSIATGITASPMYIIIDNTVSVDNLGISGPGTLKVAYVRVWQHN